MQELQNATCVELADGDHRAVGWGGLARHQRLQRHHDLRKHILRQLPLHFLWALLLHGPEHTCCSPAYQASDPGMSHAMHLAGRLLRAGPQRLSIQVA